MKEGEQLYKTTNRFLSVIVSALIDYIETSCPEMQSGFLTFASSGHTAKLNCDYIGFVTELEQRSDLDRMTDKIKTIF